MIEGTGGLIGNGSPPEHARLPRVTNPQGTHAGGVDLARLINWATPLAWFEAVAIVQELCHVLLATRGDGSDGDLEPGDVVITPQGTVEFRDERRRALPSVAGVAHLLLALLEEAQGLPVQLRLLALEATAPSQASSSLGEWSARLAAFERPGRTRTIREVHDRFTRMPAQASEPRAQAPARAGAALARRPWWANGRLKNAAAAVALLAGAGLAAAWLWQVVAPMLTEERKQPDGDAVSSAEADAALSAAKAARIREAAFRIWGVAPPRAAAPAPDVALAAHPIVVVVPSRLPSVSPSEADALRPGLDAPAGARVEPADTATYAAADMSVAPPTLLRPRLPTRPSTGVREENLPQVELLVSPTGEVESVKLLTQPASVTSAMMLSAIKTWRFAPASRDGRPVRYRLLLRLTNE
jgi:hypothetical protein